MVVELERLREYLKELEECHRQAIKEMEDAKGTSTMLYRYSQGSVETLKRVIDEMRNLIREFAGGEEDVIPTDEHDGNKPD